MEIEGYAEDATGLRLVDEYRFSSVEFTDQQTSGGAGTNVELTLDYGRFEQGHVDAAGAVTSFLWDGAPTVMDCSLRFRRTPTLVRAGRPQG